MGYDLSIPDRLNDYGLKVREVAGWQTRGSSSFNPRGSVTHHTVGPKSGNSPSLGVVTNGRAGLSGPLANVLQARDNTIYVVAAGRANHAGRGGWHGLSGNYSVFGNEVENTGYNTGPKAEPWRPDQIETMALVAAAMSDGRWGYDANCFHKEWTTRKIDPHSLSGPSFRGRISALLGGAAPNTPSSPSNPSKEEDMLKLVKGSGPAIYSTDFVTKTHLSGEALGAIQYTLGLAGMDSNVNTVPQGLLDSLPTNIDMGAAVQLVVAAISAKIDSLDVDVKLDNAAVTAAVKEAVKGLTGSSASAIADELSKRLQS